MTTARRVDRRLRRSSTTDWPCQAGASARRCSTSARCWRINELGRLRDLGRISSVSGGSIAAALLAVAWPELEFDEHGPGHQPSRHLREARDAACADCRWTPRSSRSGWCPWSNPARSWPRSSTATSSRAGRSRTCRRTAKDPCSCSTPPTSPPARTGDSPGPYMGSYRMGLVRDPTVRLADAVAASAAFPPIVSPLTLAFDPETLEATEGADLHDEIAALGRVALTDGGAPTTTSVSPRSCDAAGPFSSPMPAATWASRATGAGGSSGRSR